MKIVSPLFPRGTRKTDIISLGSCIKCFPGWARFNFGGLLGRVKILREAIFKMADTKLDEKLLSSVVYDHIRT